MIALYLAAIGGALYALYALIMGVRRDRVLAQLKRKERTDELVAIAKATQEIESAKINYAKSRTELDKFMSDNGLGPEDMRNDSERP